MQISERVYSVFKEIKTKKGDNKMKKYMYLLLVIVFVASVLFFGVSCKEEAAEEAVAEAAGEAAEEATGEAAEEATVVAEEELFISVISHNDITNPYQLIVGNGVTQAGIDFGVKVEYVSPPKIDAVAQIALIDGAIAKGADGLSIAIADVDALTPIVRGYADQGIPIVIHQTGVAAWRAAGAICYIGGDSYPDGQFVASVLVEDYGSKNPAIVMHVPGEKAIEERDAGFFNYLEEKGIEGTEIITTVASSEETAASLKAAFVKDPTIDGITGGWCGITGALIVPILEELGLLDQVTVGIMDFTPEYLQLVKEGKAQWSTSLQQWTNGYYSVAFLVNKVRFGVSPVGKVLTGPFVIDENNVDDVIAGIESGLGSY